MLPSGLPGFPGGPFISAADKRTLLRFVSAINNLPVFCVSSSMYRVVQDRCE